MRCPWNRFAAPDGDPAFNPREYISQPTLIRELELSAKDFNRKFKDSPIQRAKRRGYLRNVAVVLGNQGQPEVIPALEKALKDAEPMVRNQAAWAIERIRKHNKQNEKITDRYQQPR
jgi:epoxyqueuosine reductase